MKTKLLASLFCSAFACVSVGAADAPPATQPAAVDPEIARLIKQLGDDDFHVREDAQNALIKKGQAAVAALTQATNSSDLEVSLRAKAALAKINGTDQEDVPPAPIQPIYPRNSGRGFVGGRNTAVTITIVNGNKDVQVTEDARTIHIVEGADGITMTVTDNGAQPQVYKARNADEMKADHPDAYDLYDRYTNMGAGGRGGFGGRRFQRQAVDQQIQTIRLQIQMLQQQLQQASSDQERQAIQREIDRQTQAIGQLQQIREPQLP